MDHMDSKRGDRDIDLESGGLIREDNESEILDPSGDNSGRLLRRSWSGLLGEQLKNGSVSRQDGLHSNGKTLAAEDFSLKNSEITENQSNKFKDNKGNPRGKKPGKEKLKKPKPSKPPRPPKGPSLDAADIKLVKEISEMTVRKHRRMERLSALKKMKDRSSSKTNIVAMGVTILFFFIIIFHGTNALEYVNLLVSLTLAYPN